MTVTSAPTLITTPFGSTATAVEVIDDVELPGKRALVTGGSSGIGIQTARALATAGAEVTITARNLTAGREVVAAIVASTGSANVDVLFAVEATRRWAADGTTANAVQTGSIAESDLSRYMDSDARAALVGWAWDTYFPKTPQQGAATSVLLATSTELQAVGGRYFEDCNEAAVVDVPDPSNPPTSGVASYAVDPVNADRLWSLSPLACSTS
jgi:NAD(P)-dependent dehydrogenase (short-subunit alcohol dehydrogenase family)